jgi:hypothetical protein
MADARDWVWAADVAREPSSSEILRVLRECMHDNHATLPFFPLDLLKSIASQLDYGPSARPVSELPALLRHADHPAHLVREDRIIYLHVWDQLRGIYVRGFLASFPARKTPSGIQFNPRMLQYRLRFEITDEEWGILGKTDDFPGVLAEWMATEVNKDPVLYLGEAGKLLLGPGLVEHADVRKDMLLAYLENQVANPSSPSKVTCCYKIEVERHTYQANVEVLEAGQVLYRPPSRQEHAATTVSAAQSRKRPCESPSPCDLVQPNSVNDQTCLLSGLFVKGLQMAYATRVMQVDRRLLAPSDDGDTEPASRYLRTE